MLSVGYVGQKTGYSSGVSGGVWITRKNPYFALFFIVILHQKSASKREKSQMNLSYSERKRIRKKVQIKTKRKWNKELYALELLLIWLSCLNQMMSRRVRSYFRVCRTNTIINKVWQKKLGLRALGTLMVWKWSAAAQVVNTSALRRTVQGSAQWWWSRWNNGLSASSGWWATAWRMPVV